MATVRLHHHATSITCTPKHFNPQFFTIYPFTVTFFHLHLPLQSHFIQAFSHLLDEHLFILISVWQQQSIWTCQSPLSMWQWIVHLAQRWTLTMDPNLYCMLQQKQKTLERLNRSATTMGRETKSTVQVGDSLWVLSKGLWTFNCLSSHGYGLTCWVDPAFSALF